MNLLFSWLRKISLNIGIVSLVILLLANINNSIIAQSNSNNLYGGIEVGAKGVKPIVVEITYNENGQYEADIKQSETINTTIVEGLEKTGNFSLAAIQNTAEAVSALYKKMREGDKVSSDHIYIVGSSALKAANRNELITKVHELTRKNLTFIEIDQEVILSILGLIPKQDAYISVLIDVGSGNTKGGYQLLDPSGKPSFPTIKIPYGTVTLTEAIGLSNNTSEIATLIKEKEDLVHKLISTPLKEQINKDQTIQSRKRVYLSGGIVWAMATLLHPTNRSTFVELTAQDIDTFFDKVKHFDKVKDPDLSQVDPKIAESIKEDLSKIRSVFTPQNLTAGALILKSLSTALSFQDKKLYFSRQGHLAWLFTYITETSSKK